MVAKAVLLCGGPSKGTRMRPLSLDIPKPLFPIAGRPMIWHALQSLDKLDGLKEVLMIGFYEDAVFAPFVKEASRDFPNLNIRYMREYTSLGTAGGLYHFRDRILAGNPDQIFVIHADICCSYPLEGIKDFHDGHRGVGTILGVKVPRDSASKYGCIVTDARTHQARHYVEKPESFISDTINGGVYLFDKSIFDEIRHAMDLKSKRREGGSGDYDWDPTQGNDEQLRLEQDVIAPLADNKKLYVYETQGFWRQIKTAGSVVPANALILATYKTTNPSLLRRRSPTIVRSGPNPRGQKKTPTIVEPCFIDETAEVDPTAKIGPNVSIGAGVKIGFGVRVKDSMVLDNTVLEKNCTVLYSVVCEDCHIGPWARVEGTPAVPDASASKQSITILAKDVAVVKECYIRSCIVLPHKTLDRSFTNEVLL